MKSNSGAVLLFTLITLFFFSLVAATFISYTTNQFRQTHSLRERGRAIGRAKAGMEYAIWWAREHPADLPGAGDGALPVIPPAELEGVSINIYHIEDPALPATFNNLSDYGIQVTCDYHS